MDFKVVKKAVQAQFELMKGHELFRANVDKDKLWETYLGAFPEGTNPMFRERTEHDCSCCRSFVKNAGAIVTIVNGKLISIWDVTGVGGYQPVVDALSALVKAAAIENIYLNIDKNVGTDKSLELIDGKTKTWDHFHVQLPAKVIARGEDLGTKLGNARTTKEMMLRALIDIEDDAIDTVLELIAQNSLYRGSEKKHLVVGFKKLKDEYKKAADKELFCWVNSIKIEIGVSRIRNDVVGTLLLDLSNYSNTEGREVPAKELRDALGAWNFKMAPGNYQQPDVGATKKQLEAAYAEVEAAGFMPSLERRYACLADIKINNVIFADRSVRAAIASNVFTDLITTAPGAAIVLPKLDKIEAIHIDDFIKNVLTLPTTTSVEVLFENRLNNNLVSLLGAVHADAPSMFKWDNTFNWMYNGDLADSSMIKERVKEDGGKVDGVLRFSIMWSGDNKDNSDLDAHCKEPTGEIYFGHKVAASGGTLDIDITQPVSQRGLKPAVENITYPSLRTMRNGDHVFFVNQYASRSSKGFSAEIEFDGQTFHYEYPKAVSGNVKVATVHLKDGVFTITHHLPNSTSVKEAWGLTTQSFNKVSAIMFSPNYWDGREDDTMGNRHVFFMMQGCVRDDDARGFVNEHLHGSLTQHRKAFQMVGSKLRVAESPDQLSGIGISSTQAGQHIIVKVTGKTSRMLKVTF